MTNREWLLNKMQNMSDEEFAISVVLPEEAFKEQTCIGCCNNCKNEPCIVDWLKSEHKEKPKLSEAERVILENIDKDYIYIARDRDGDLYIYAEKPIKKHSNWNDGIKSNEFNCYCHLFQFVTWEDDEPYNIEKLLKEQ